MLRPYIQLYIDGKEIDFTEPININMTYAHTDLHNPTVVKNSFSKTLNIAGTPNNNRIFGCFGNMDRIVAFKDGEYIGAYFNPSRKVDFALVRNGEQIERGYVKLDKVTKKGKQLSYDITLYGGLGQFLYNLQYKEDGEKMKLSDLDYGYEMDFEVNKNAVKDAWNRINKIGLWQDDDLDIYEHINFAPCYNGIPENFSADKVAINVNSFPSDEYLYKSFTKSKDGYTLVDGWLLAELKKEYDEWQMCDLRSYLQRPVIRFKDVINACCNPDNNGGYEVELDKEFFSADNPYYENAWMTLPLYNELSTIEPIIIKDTSFTNNNGNITVSGCESGKTYDVTIPFALNAVVEDSSTNTLTTSAYFECSGKYNDGASRGNSFASTEDTGGLYYAQLVAYNSNNTAVAGSQIIVFGGPYFKESYYLESVFKFTPIFRTTFEKKFSIWYKQPDETYTFDDRDFQLTIDNLKYESGMYFKIILKEAEYANGYDYIEHNHTDMRTKFYQERNYIYKPTGNIKQSDCDRIIREAMESNYIIGEARTIANVQDGYVEEVEVLDGEKRLKKKNLLNSENTPCDYFLSYLKMFNLHIWSDNIEKKVYIKQRKNYFIDNVIDIDNLVDRNSDITIKPVVYDAKWYNFNTEFDGDSYLNTNYKNGYGFDYGIQKVNTNYNFDSSSKDLLDKSVFKNAITQRAKSKYYVSVYEDYDNLPPFYLDGFTTLLFNGAGDTIEGNKFTPRTTVKSYNWWDRKGYDFMPKPEFRDKDGKGVDGANVLLFYNGSKYLEDPDGNRLPFMITDDIQQFETLNDGEPCWIWSMSWSDYNPINYLPIFSRYLTNENNWVTHSWDFGTPKQIYIPDYNIDNSSDIYTNYWKNYINDEFDINTREVELKVLLKGKVNPDFLQNFVYYDGCYWKIMEIVDYNPCSQECTKVKMVKVQDKNNYLT